MEKEPRKGIFGEWDRLSPKMRLVALILLVVPVVLYPPSAILFLAYVALLNIRDKRK